MSSILERVPRQGRIAVIRIRSMGDCILTTPALSILKQSRPDLAIAMVVEERFWALFEGNADVSEILPPDWKVVRRWRPDLCLNLHGGTSSAVMTALSGARFRAGFGHFRGSWIYNVKIPRAQHVLGVDGKVHTAEHLASAVFFLGARRIEIPRAKLFATPVRRGRSLCCDPPAGGGGRQDLARGEVSGCSRAFREDAGTDSGVHRRPG